MRTLQHPAIADLSLPAVLYALSDPVRLRIAQSLAQSGERACGSFGIPLAKATLSHHFKVLRENGVIAMRAVGTQRLCSLRRAELDARFPGLLDAILRAGDGHAGIAPHPPEDRIAPTCSAP